MAGHCSCEPLSPTPTLYQSVSCINHFLKCLLFCFFGRMWFDLIFHQTYFLSSMFHFYYLRVHFIPSYIWLQLSSLSINLHKKIASLSWKTSSSLFPFFLPNQIKPSLLQLAMQHLLSHLFASEQNESIDFPSCMSELSLALSLALLNPN